jgi:hypothetical protein
VKRIKMDCWETAYIAGIIDGEGSISLTRMNEREHRRPSISIASTDKELLIYIQSLSGGTINIKKNYNPDKHKDSFTLNIKNKEAVISLLRHISPYLRVEKKRNRAQWILKKYEEVTPRNGKYNLESLEKKLAFEESFFRI